MEEEVPSLEELKKLKVVELKARLSSLGLHTSGRLVNYSFLCLSLTGERVFALLVDGVLLHATFQSLRMRNSNLLMNHVQVEILQTYRG